MLLPKSKPRHRKFDRCPEPTPRKSFFPGLVLRDPETGRLGRPLTFVLCLIAAIAVAAWFRPDLTLPEPALRALFILVLAVLLWVTEVIPAFAVGILVIALNVALLGRPGESDGEWEQVCPGDWPSVDLAVFWRIRPGRWNGTLRARSPPGAGIAAPSGQSLSKRAAGYDVSDVCLVDVHVQHGHDGDDARGAGSRVAAIWP